jgi:hypothetical protein
MLFVRDVIEMAGARRLRIVGVVDGAAVLFDLGSSRTCLETAELAELVRGVARGKIIVVTDVGLNAVRNDRTSAAQLKRARELHAIVTTLLGAGPAVFDRAARGHLVATAAQASGRTSTTLHAALHRFWKSGMTIDALLPAFDRCGAHGRPRGGDSPLGRKPPPGAKGAPRLTEEMLSAFRKGADRYYRDNPRNSLAEAFRLICDDLVTSCVFDPATGAPITFVTRDREDVVLPTLRQFRYWYSKQNRARDDHKARTHEAKYEQRHRAKLSYAAQDNENIGGRYIIDSTPLDANLISRLNATTFLSTATLYLVTDELTAFIVGFALSFEDASWTAAGLALLSAVEDKVALCARYGIAIEEDDWPIADLVAMCLLFDKGEAKGPLAEQFGFKSSLTIENTASYRGDLKGLGEQRFDLVNEACRGRVPGYRVKGSGDRGEQDPRLDAILTLDDAIGVIIHTILFLNRREITSFRRSLAMIEDDVPPIPLEMWRWAMRNGRTALVRRSYPEMMVALLPTGVATITQQGLCFEGLFYTCAFAEREKWFEFVTLPASLRKKTVSFHPWLVDAIYVQDGENAPFEVAVLTPHSARFAGLSFEELKKLNEAERGRARNREIDQTLNHAAYSNHVKRIVEEAAARRLHRLRPRDLAGARGARSAEREFDREEHRDTLREIAADFGGVGQPLARLPAPEAVRGEDLGDGGLATSG